jgi:transportin-3
VEAWNIAPQLIDNGAFGEPAQFYGAQILHAKIAYDFAQLPPEEYDAVRNALFGFVLRFKNGPAAIRNKLCASVAALAVQMPNWDDVVNDIITLLPLNDDSGMLLCQLLVLTELPYECWDRRLFVARERRELVDAQLAAAAPRLAQHYVQCMQAAGADTSLQVQVFRCLESLLRNCRFNAGVLVDNPLVAAPFDAIAVPALFEVSVDLICELLRVSGKQLSAADDASAEEVDQEAANEQASARFAAQSSAERQGALALAGQVRDCCANIVCRDVRLQLVPLVLRLRATFVGGGVDRDDESTFAGYTRIFAEVGEYYVAQLIAPGSSAALEIVAVLLDCASQPSVDIFAITARFWSLLAREIGEDATRRELFAPA